MSRIMMTELDDWQRSNTAKSLFLKLNKYMFAYWLSHNDYGFAVS